MSKKLGYTWYPKDWISSESVFELTLEERGLYRELIDLAYTNDNKVEVKKEIWCRRFFVNIVQLNKLLDKFIKLKLILINENILVIPSCEPRLNLIRGGSKGGSSKGNTKPDVKPDINPDTKPDTKQIEIENKTETETEINFNSELVKEQLSKIDLKQDVRSAFFRWIEYDTLTNKKAWSIQRIDTFCMATLRLYKSDEHMIQCIYKSIQGGYKSIVMYKEEEKKVDMYNAPGMMWHDPIKNPLEIQP